MKNSTEKLMKKTKAELVKALQESTQNLTVKNVRVEMKVFDDKAIESIDKVAQGLLNLTELFKAQNIEIESALKIQPGKTVVIEK